MTMPRPDGIWDRPRLKRAINHAYLYVLNLAHLVLNLAPWFLRNAIWRLTLRRCGPGVFFDYGVYVKFPWLVSIGTNVSINRGVEFYPGLRGRSQIFIGSNVRIAPNAKFHAAGHDPDDPYFQDIGESIVVEDDVWIGAGAIILPGTFIKRGAVVAAGSVVRGEIQPFSIVGGVPARHIRNRRLK